MNFRAKECNQQIGDRNLKPEIVQAIALVDKVSLAFKLMGRQDKAEGNEAFTTEKFAEWGSNQFPNDPETAAYLAELMQLHYMDGFNREGEA